MNDIHIDAINNSHLPPPLQSITDQMPGHLQLPQSFWNLMPMNVNSNTNNNNNTSANKNNIVQLTTMSQLKQFNIDLLHQQKQEHLGPKDAFKHFKFGSRSGYNDAIKIFVCVSRTGKGFNLLNNREFRVTNFEASYIDRFVL